MSIAQFLIESGAFRGQDTTLKSGRLSPYFFNTGDFDDGAKILRLGYYYARKIVQEMAADGFDVIYGPAYKGISLAVAICISLFSDFGLVRKFSFNRKEEKAHGEGGTILGHRISDGEKVIIVDDVFTTGGTKLEAVHFIKGIAPGAEIKGLLIALDRQETDEKGGNGIAQFTRATGIPVYSLITISEFLEAPSYPASEAKEHQFLLEDALREKIRMYLKEYGVTGAAGTGA